MEISKFPYKLIALAIIVLIILGLLFGQNEAVPLLSAGNAAGEASDNTPATPGVTPYYYEVAGQVNSPGVYSSNGPLLVMEAINRANGFTAQADRKYVEKNIRLAINVRPGEKIYIPALDEELVTEEQTAGGDGRINFNTASMAALDAIPGVGPATAQKIIAARPITDCSDLQKISGISSSLKEKLVDLCL